MKPDVSVLFPSMLKQGYKGLFKSKLTALTAKIDGNVMEGIRPSCGVKKGKMKFIGPNRESNFKKGPNKEFSLHTKLL